MSAFNATRATAVVVIVFCGFAYYLTLGYPRDAALLPRGLLIVLAVCAAALFVRSYAGNGKKDSFVLKNPRQLCIGAALAAAYVALIHVLGYYLASLLFIVAVTWLVGFRRPLLAGAVGILYSLGIYVAFEYLLKIPMP